MNTEKYIKKIVQETPAILTLNEAKLLFSLPQKIPKIGVIVEIGSYKGASTILLAKASKIAKRGKVYAIDPFNIEIKINKPIQEVRAFKKNIFPIFLKNIKKARLADWVVPIVKTSTKAAKNWNRPISLLWIDGNHDYKFVKEDFVFWEKHLKKGGLIAFHDSRDIGIFSDFCRGPRKVVKEHILNSKRFINIKVVQSITLAEKSRDAGYIELFRNRLGLYQIQLIFNLDKILGLIGIFLDKNLPRVYKILKSIKNFITKERKRGRRDSKKEKVKICMVFPQQRRSNRPSFR